MTDHARWRPMIGSRPGELTADEARGLADHLARCEACRAFAADVEATSGLVSEALLARAAKRDFAPFVDQVMARVAVADDAAAAAARARGEPGTGSSVRPEPVEGRAAGLLPWLSAHRRAVMAVLTPAVAALALIVYFRAGERPEVAQLEVAGEGEATTVIQTSDGPIVLLAPEEHT